MAFFNDRVFDSGLTVLDTEVNRLDICSLEPTTYAQATSTNTLGNKLTPTVGAPTDRSPTGRKVVVSAITDGTVTGTGTATHWALTDTGNSRLLATGQLSASQGVSSGNTFTLGAFDIGMADPT